MRRLSCAFAALLLIAPAALRLAGTGSDAEALRCAIACGHAAAGVAPGAACCPMNGAGTLAISSCPSGDSPAAAPVSVGQPAILSAIQPLTAPAPGDSVCAFSDDAPRGPAALPPDHVPILLS